MQMRLVLVAVFSLALAACDGTRFVDHAPDYQADMARAAGPVAITVLGAARADRAAIVAAVSDALTYNGVQAGALAPAGNGMSGYRVAILYGTAASTLLPQGRDGAAADSCRAVAGSAGARLDTTSSSATQAQATPLAALLCDGGQYRAMAYATLHPGEPAVVALPMMIDQLFPPPPLSD